MVWGSNPYRDVGYFFQTMHHFLVANFYIHKKLSTMIGLQTKHEDCRITFKSYLFVSYNAFSKASFSHKMYFSNIRTS